MSLLSVLTRIGEDLPCKIDAGIGQYEAGLRGKRQSPGPPEGTLFVTRPGCVEGVFRVPLADQQPQVASQPAGGAEALDFLREVPGVATELHGPCPRLQEEGHDGLKPLRHLRE